MAKSIKSFNADEEVLALASEQKVTNFSKWANEMIKKGHNSTIEIPKSESLLVVKRVRA